MWYHHCNRTAIQFCHCFIAYSNYELRAQSLIHLRHYCIGKCPEKSYWKNLIFHSFQNVSEIESLRLNYYSPHQMNLNLSQLSMLRMLAWLLSWNESSTIEYYFENLMALSRIFFLCHPAKIPRLFFSSKEYCLLRWWLIIITISVISRSGSN